ncbi:MAG: alpha/beta hydrolase [Nonomuraea sp.]|nr:alpha/beta hydrolase [Nonomuraea sp.]
MHTTYVLVHGAWYGAWAWDRLTPLLRATGADVITPELSGHGGLHEHADEVAAALPDSGRTVLVGHSYAGLVVRQAADLRPDAVSRLALIEGWAGGDGASLFGLAPESFETAIRGLAVGDLIPPPPPETFGLEQDYAQKLRPQPLRSFAEPTRLTGAVDAIEGIAVYCRPQRYPFDRFAGELGYESFALDGPHDLMHARPDAVAELLIR